MGWKNISHYFIFREIKDNFNPTNKMAEENWGEEEWGGDEATAPTTIEVQDIKLFGRWNPDEVQVSDISLTDYIAVKEKHAVYLPHTAGRYAQKRFRKAQCPIVERLTNSLMMHGRNNGKKLMTVRIVKHSFEIIHLLTGENPLQVCVMQSSIVVLEKIQRVLD